MATFSVFFIHSIKAVHSYHDVRDWFEEFHFYALNLGILVDHMLLFTPEVTIFA